MVPKFVKLNCYVAIADWSKPYHVPVHKTSCSLLALMRGPVNNREVKIPRFRCTGTGSMILVSNIFVDVCTFTRN